MCTDPPYTHRWSVQPEGTKQPFFSLHIRFEGGEWLIHVISTQQMESWGGICDNLVNLQIQ
jgi:hypothetical protein